MRRSLMLTAALTAASVQTAAAEQGDWLVRLRAITVAPTEDVSAVMRDFRADQQKSIMLMCQNSISPISSLIISVRN